MITTGAKFWFALTAFGLVAAVVYFATADGEWYGTLVLTFLAIAAAVLGTMSVAVRDGDVDVPAEGQVVEETPRPQSLPAAWPVAAALGVAVAAIGLAARNALLWVGVAILVATFVEWMVQAWAERSTSDPRANMGLRNRIMFPVEIPVLAVIGVGLIVLAFSRVLLAVPRTASAVIAIVVATAILLVAAVLANRPRLSSSVLSGVVAFGAVALVAGGIAGAVVGEREFEHHGDDEHVDEQVDEPEGIEAPEETRDVDVGTDRAVDPLEERDDDTGEADDDAELPDTGPGSADDDDSVRQPLAGETDGDTTP